MKNLLVAALVLVSAPALANEISPGGGTMGAPSSFDGSTNTQQHPAVERAVERAERAEEAAKIAPQAGEQPKPEADPDMSTDLEALSDAEEEATIPAEQMRR